MNFQFKQNRYSLSSNLIFGTFIIGLANLFIYDPESTTDFVIMAVVLISRYLLFILIKRRFTWSIYLLIILIMRSAYRFVYIMDSIKISQITKISVVTQFVLSVTAFILLFIAPKISAKRAEREKNKQVSFPEVELPVN